jgi:hypothetical protein
MLGVLLDAFRPVAVVPNGVKSQTRGRKADRARARLRCVGADWASRSPRRRLAQIGE